MILADLKIGGRLRQVLIQAPKNGFFYVLDRATGELISARPYAIITWARHRHEDGQARRESRRALQGQDGGGDAAGTGGPQLAADGFDPQTGLVYIPAMDGSAIFIPVEGSSTSPRVWNTGNDFAAVARGPAGDRRAAIRRRPSSAISRRGIP